MLWISAIILCVGIGLVELAPNDQSIELQSPEQNCSLYGEKDYHVYSLEPLNWYAAAQYCFFRGWQLANPMTPRDDELILKALKASGIQNPDLYWIGGTNLGDLISYYWVSFGKKFEYTNWAPGKPDNLNNNQHCALYVREDDLNQWDDENCDQKAYFICEDRPECTHSRYLQSS